MSFKLKNLFKRGFLKAEAIEAQESHTSNSTENSGIRLIVGLGNPGPQYAFTRHNAGERWVRAFAQEHNVALKLKRKFSGYTGTTNIDGETVHVLIPTTYMNRSGQSVGTLSRFFAIAVNQILIAHDEVAFPMGVTKIKEGGGLNGHRGLESVVEHFGGVKDFLRLRIGIGHPGQASLVSAYLTKEQISQSEWQQIIGSAQLKDEILEALIKGDSQRAMLLLHTESTS
ncbi:MAG: aminoacyl-tRNA hydrolase [Gammaproteobacteria bacterium]|nr:aminoacyl-tRNA hydrolase [Gammaproteobacteria bacterium]MXX94807.1 aminoacyl-tRNA hydrolase [Gammaproteobacteria bacterium]MYF53363.1 aminoacyl-tRNA hydrolase [Gammaproteobacteria bacterium]MYK42867.1 aminoacyl-tRNA hydrolase [Gammaproteobacteria bacterium]